jgi:hypothetical protein
VKSYAGIGSRSISKEEYKTILSISSYLKEDYIVYSGNAEGSDISFQEGSQGKCVLYLPWKNFNTENYNINKSLDSFIVGETKEGIASLEKYHPNPLYLKRGARLLMSRNYHQIFGYEKYPKVSFVLCCADEDKYGNVKGGTGQAVRIAKDNNVPVFNIRNKNWKKELDFFLTFE